MTVNLNEIKDRLARPARAVAAALAAVALAASLSGCGPNNANASQGPSVTATTESVQPNNNPGRQGDTERDPLGIDNFNDFPESPERGYWAAAAYEKASELLNNKILGDITEASGIVAIKLTGKAPGPPTGAVIDYDSNTTNKVETVRIP
jgi:hypothetical protein